MGMDNWLADKYKLSTVVQKEMMYLDLNTRAGDDTRTQNCV